jgi:hypothetical protein
MAQSLPNDRSDLKTMPVALQVPRVFRAILIASACLAAAGCSLLAGDFAPRTAGTTATNTAPAAGSAIEAKPAVLVQEGTVQGGSTPAPQQNVNVDSLSLLPGDSAAPTSKLSPEEKARVIAELEALARGQAPAPQAVSAKPECATAAAAAAKPGAQPVALPPGCAASPKPSVRP